MDLPRYDPAATYETNYAVQPQAPPTPVPVVPGDWRFLGRRLTAPLGIAAGPLLHGGWCRYYAELGFDVVTYKTVRSIARACYPLPNLQPVECGQLAGGEERLPAATEMHGTWAVAFGMPSQPPEVWREDVRRTRTALAPEKMLVVSVVGSVQPEWKLERLAEDYAQCAVWAAESGADAVEANFSCPNVSTCDGQLYQHPHDAQLVAARMRDRLGRTPLVIKIGHVTSEVAAAELLDVLAPYVDAISTTNSVAATIVDSAGQLLFDGQKRGICGDAIRTASLRQVAMLRSVIDRGGLPYELIGVGGVSTADHVRQYLSAGATHLQLATAAMVNPRVGLEIRESWQ